MTEEDLDLANTCSLCAGHNVSTNRKGQRLCRDCGNIAPAGTVVSEGLYSKIKRIFRVKGEKKAKKAKKQKKKKRAEKSKKVKQKKLKKLNFVLRLRKKARTDSLRR